MECEINSSELESDNNYQQYMDGIIDKLYYLAKNETELRLKTLIHAVNDVCSICTVVIFIYISL